MKKHIAHRRIRPAVSWPGGKTTLLKHIMPLIPNHTYYCEPFSGGLAVLLAKKPVEMEVINDLNRDLINFYRCVRYHEDPLLTELEFVLNSREEFRDFIDQPGLTDIQRAARWFYRNKNCFGGSSLTSFSGFSSSSRQARMETIRSLNYRLDRTVIENLPWDECVSRYDRTGTFFFIDPPYLNCDAGMYRSWGEKEALQLRDRVDRIKGTWMITLNDSQQVRQIFKGCRIKAVSRPRGIENRKGGQIYKEIIIRP